MPQPSQDADIVAGPARRIAVRRLGVVQAPLLLERKTEVVQRRRARAAFLGGEPERLLGLVPASLPERDEAEVERRAPLARSQVGHAAELALRLVEHRGLVEGDPEIAMLFDPSSR